jgi:serine protease Do
MLERVVRRKAMANKSLRSSWAVFAILVWLCCASATDGQEPATNELRKVNESVQALIKRVSPCVVQILVTGFGAVEETEHGNTGVVIGRQRAIGSGFVIDANGYIMTNAHVVKGAENIQVVLPSATADTSARSALAARGTIVPARVVGVARDMDLALLKVEAERLPKLALAPYRELQQGELVFAFGSPEGLRNSVTMGVVSATARQLDPDSPLVYVQTDAPINPGNSGGPLVNDGRPADSLPFVAFHFLGRERGEAVHLELQRQQSELSFDVPMVLPEHEMDQITALANPAKNVVRPLGIVGIEIDKKIAALLPELRAPYGIVVVARTADSGTEVPLETGDVIRALNGEPMRTLDQLRDTLGKLPPGSGVALQIQRDERLMFATFTTE